MTEDYKEKVKDIEEVYALWKGLYISPNSAMSRIGDIIKSEYKIIKNGQFLDSKGNNILTTNKAIIKVNKI